ncbi:hypothetical protein MLD38_020463 [Melastoma candidum]|uniref:Uncharacterized protein n=3 Tax=Melastoma candidum TaxID=119954 RepID=A0ACB9QE82_9MYRT|nr:hypothetical protein MLD38_020463 [Melastoma candidum]
MGQAPAIGSFPVEDMALEIAENRFKVEPCGVMLTPSRKKGESLVLPDLRLKVLIEAHRMVLEVVYDERLMMFCYGGRVGMGRLTAVSGLDREIQEFRLRVNRESRNVDAAKIPTSSNVSYRPAKVFAVKYMDEILITTFGSKVLMMDLRKKILDRIESNLGLKVDGMRSTICSAVSDRLEFLGMELQAVPPSVLNPPMTEKEVRARKKYLRQKEVQAQERRNARERNRRKLGMKILSHQFRKLKRNNGFRLNLPIEDEVRAIFSRWADETVQEFFHSLEERYNWHRMLTAGNFMSLRHIRDQLPAALVDAYDEFQAQIEKHLSPYAMMAALEEEEREKEEETERKYADQTANDLTRTVIKVDAPIQLEAIKHYTKDLIVTDEGENEVAYFPSEKEVKMMGDRNLSSPMPIDGALTLVLVRLASDVEPPYPLCGSFL